MFEPYINHPNNKEYRLERTYGEMLTQIGKHITQCVNEGHFGDDTYFDYIPTAISFATAFYDTLANNNMELHITMSVASQATEVLGGTIVSQALKGLYDVGALGALYDPDDNDDRDWVYDMGIDSKTIFQTDTDQSSWIVEARPKK